MKIVLSTWLKEFYFVREEISRVKNGLWRKNYTKEQILERNGLRTDEIIQKWMQIL
jgi:hypothetical protein